MAQHGLDWYCIALHCMVLIIIIIIQGRTKSIIGGGGGGGFRRGSRGPHRPPGGVKGLFFCFVSFREGTCIG